VPDIRLDPDRLDELACELRALRSEFDSLEERVEDYEAAVGHRRVADRLESLAGNWSDARKDVLERLEGLARVCQQVAKKYRDQEAALSGTMDAAAGKTVP
jgi:hypothetical protein